MKRTENKVVLVVRQTRLDELVARYNTLDQARFYVEHMGVDFGDYVAEHDQYKRAVAVAETLLGELGRVQVLRRRYLPSFIFGPTDLVVCVGQDGLVANTLKYLDGQRVIGVNPDPPRYDGVLLPFVAEDLRRVVPEVWRDGRSVSEVTMAEAELTDGQRLLAVNDFFIGARTHVSARYRVSVDGRSEQQSSSGIIVSTGLGATGWLKSVLAGATGIVASLDQRDGPPPGIGDTPWDADYLYYSVREPFPSRVTGASVVFGRITAAGVMRVESQMPGYGVIFSDGIERDFLEFNSGMTATLRPAEKTGRLVV